ncbi:MAG: YfhO family protein, partial [Chloroflexota bacterium]|nr:YfhO family protein [Chloroflexota bacterium]
GWGLLGGAGLLVVVALGRQERQGRGLALLVPLAALADLWSVGRGYNPTVPPAAYFPPTAVTDLLQAQPGPARSVATGWILPPNTNLAYGLADLRGYDALTPQTYYDLLRALDPTLPVRAGGGLRPLMTLAPPLLDLLNGRYLPAAPGDTPNERLDVQQDGAHDEVVGEITGPYRVGQTFVAGADGLTAVQVVGATFGHPAAGRLRFHLQRDPAAATDLATVTVDAATLGDEATWTFRFPPLRQAQGRTFYFYFDAPDVAAAQAVTVYYTKGNPYPAGSRMQDGRPAGGDLVFRTIVALDPDHPPFERVLDGGSGGTSVYLNRNAQPRAWLVHRVETVADPAARVRRLAEPAFDRAGTALLATPLPADQPLTTPPAAGTDKVTILGYAPETVDLATRSDTAGLLVLADQAFPGWSATVDGQAAPILTADHALRGVYLPAGAHSVRFTYAPLVFRLGAALTLIALLVVGWLGIKKSPAQNAGDAVTRREAD